MSPADLVQELRERIEAYPASYSSEARKLDRALLDALADKDAALAEALAELTEFDETNRQLVKTADGWRDKYRAAEAALAEMRVELERAREALKPFATFSDHKTSYVELPVRWCIDAARALGPSLLDEGVKR